MRLAVLLVASVLPLALGGSRAAAEPAAAPLALDAREPIAQASRFRLDLRAGVGVRDDTLTTDTARIGARGTALSDLVLGGAWFSPRSPLGIAGRLELDHFALRGSTGDSADADVSATAFEVHAAAAARIHPHEQVMLEGQVGYGLLQVPLAGLPSAAGTFPGQADGITAHGPVLLALAAVAPSDLVSLELSARYLPVTFGGRYRDTALGLHRLAGGVGASIGRVAVADFRLAGLVSYEAASTWAEERGVAVKQLRHQIAFGVRAMPGPPRRAARVATAEENAPPVRGRIRGVVRLAGGAPLEGVRVVVAGGAVTQTAADGTFAFAGVAPGLNEMNLSRSDLVPAQEIVSVPPGGEAPAQIVLRKKELPAPTVLIGLVRGENGSPVAARVRLLEPELTVDADAQGRFRFELPAGRYTMTIEAPGFVTQRRSVRAGVGEQNIYNVDLQAAR
jgi:hypothetical protein